ncbi:hypothetical protein [Bacillus sp. SJS]|nr:hypothetical protein [Bacillus sp. SJS]
MNDFRMPHGFGERIIANAKKNEQDILIMSEKYKKKKERQRKWMEKRSID